MGLLEHYESADETLVKRTCKTCEWYRGLPKKDQIFFDEKVVDALSGQGNMQRLRRAVIASGLSIARSTFHSHIREHHDELSRQVQEERKR